MSVFNDPFDVKTKLGACSCGRHDSIEAHNLESVGAQSPASSDQHLIRVVESAVVRALFPRDEERRAFLRAIGRATAWSAISTIFPMAAATAVAAEPVGAVEKKTLNIGYIPITCATPILLGKILGYYEKNGLDVKLHKGTNGWPGIRDKVISGEYDSAQMLAPLALGIRLGASGSPKPVVVAMMENLGGHSMIFNLKHKDKRDPKQWSGFKFGVPDELSVHNFLLREYLIKHGVNPERDVKIVPMAPPKMGESLRAGEIDAAMAPEPFGQRAVHDGIAFINLISADLWDGHPCCTFMSNEHMLKELPNTFAALFRSLIQASTFTNSLENIPKVTKELAVAEYLNQPPSVIEQVLLGKYPDGLGHNKTNSRRVAFEPFPWQSMAMWILYEMKRWGYLKKDVDYKQIAEQVFLATDARKHMLDAGVRPAKLNSRKHLIDGREFDPDQPEAYFKALPEVKRM